MSNELAHLAPYLLGIFMISLACVPLLFIWQDRQRLHPRKAASQKLRDEAGLASQLRDRREGFARSEISAPRA